MTFQLVCIEPKELTQYKSDMQEAFQKGFEDAFGKTDAVILPEKDIDQSVNAEGSAVYKAVVDGEMVGGAVVIINESTQHNHLDLLFVKNGVQRPGGFSFFVGLCRKNGENVVQSAGGKPEKNPLLFPERMIQ